MMPGLAWTTHLSSSVSLACQDLFAFNIRCIDDLVYVYCRPKVNTHGLSAYNLNCKHIVIAPKQRAVVGDNSTPCLRRQLTP
jgi:hypothetical protein